MKFTTTILDMNGKEYVFQGEVDGRGMYDDKGLPSSFVIEDFSITGIRLTDPEGWTLEVESMAVMPDRFSQKDLTELEREGEEAFLNDWMEVQSDASDASYDLFISQNLAN